jgi:hypothetical protein
MGLKNAADQGSACCSQSHVGNPAIVWAGLPSDQSLFLESVDCGGNRTAGQHDLASDCIDRKRPFVQENLQDSKIRQTEAGIGNTTSGYLTEGSIRFHENQPKMDTGSVGLAGISLAAHVIVFTSR